MIIDPNYQIIPETGISADFGNQLALIFGLTSGHGVAGLEKLTPEELQRYLSEVYRIACGSRTYTEQVLSWGFREWVRNRKFDRTDFEKELLYKSDELWQRVQTIDRILRETAKWPEWFNHRNDPPKAIATIRKVCCELHILIYGESKRGQFEKKLKVTKEDA